MRNLAELDIDIDGQAQPNILDGPPYSSVRYKDLFRQLYSASLPPASEQLLQFSYRRGRATRLLTSGYKAYEQSGVDQLYI